MGKLSATKTSPIIGGSVILNLGETGNGKTRRCIMIWERFGKNYECYAVDPVYQFSEYAGKIKFINPETDIRLALKDKRIHDSVIFIDEAQNYFTHAATNVPLTQALSICRHRANLIVLNFHALQQVPVYLINYFNAIILGHTNDKDEQAKRFGKLEPKILAAMRALEKVKKKEPHAAIPIFNK